MDTYCFGVHQVSTNLYICTSIELKLLFGSHVCSSSTFYSIAVTLIVLYTKKPSDDGNDTTSTTTTEPTIVTVEPTATATATAKPTAPPTAPPTLPAGKPSRSRVTSPDYSDEEPLKVWVAYTVIANGCGLLDANTFIGGAGDVMRQGLINETTSIAINILNETFPRAGKEDGNRKLVYLSEQYPAEIDQVINVYEGCADESSCLLVTSFVPVVLEYGDDPLMIDNAVRSGMKKTFEILCNVEIHAGRKSRYPFLPYTPHLQVHVSYNFTNDCGFDAEDIMNETENSMKQGLIKATGAIVNRALKERLPTRRVQLTEQQPITIDQMLNIDQDCKQGLNCVFVTSAISLEEYGENPALVIATVTKGMRESFEDGSFFDELPNDTADCLPA